MLENSLVRVSGVFQKKSDGLGVLIKPNTIIYNHNKSFKSLQKLSKVQQRYTSKNSHLVLLHSSCTEYVMMSRDEFYQKPFSFTFFLNDVIMSLFLFLVPQDYNGLFLRNMGSKMGRVWDICQYARFFLRIPTEGHSNHYAASKLDPFTIFHSYR